jgi:hypothetical protein
MGTAVYGGERGNSLRYSVVANPVGGFDVSVYLSGKAVATYEGVTTVERLIARNSPYIAFSKKDDGVLSEVAGVTLSGGTSSETTNADVSAFLDAVENVAFNTMAFPVTEETLLTACVSKIRYLRDGAGKYVKAVVPNYAADYEGVINLTNSVVVDGRALTTAQATAWVAGADAGATNVQSNTYLAYGGATGLVGAKTHEQAAAAINAGEIFFSYSEAGAVVLEYDVNSLTTFDKPKDKTYSKNRVLRVLDTFAEAVQLNFPPNKFDNSPNGQDVMEGIGRSVLKLFLDAGAIKNVDYDADFKVDRERSAGDETYFNVGLEPVDSSEKLYFTATTR